MHLIKITLSLSVCLSVCLSLSLSFLSMELEYEAKEKIKLVGRCHQFLSEFLAVSLFRENNNVVVFQFPFHISMPLANL